MPLDAQRNMMNASSNCQIITAVIDAVRMKTKQKVFIPGAFGNMGGYPVQIGYKDGCLCALLYETDFSFLEMEQANRKSMELDGIEDVQDGTLFYADDLIRKCRQAFGAGLPKTVAYEEIEKTAEFLIREIITGTKKI